MTESLYLTVATFNANRSSYNTKVFLETNTKFDIIFIQEPRVGHIRNVPSTTDPLGDPLVGTQIHPDWIGLFPINIEKARVATYVNKRWRAASPQIIIPFSGDDFLLVRLTFPRQSFSYLNVYADPDAHSVITSLLHLPPFPADLGFAAGDFNLRHPDWSFPRPDLGQGQQLAIALVDWMSEHNLSLASVLKSPPKGGFHSFSLCFVRWSIILGYSTTT